MFGIKDIFTTINLMGGVLGICFSVDGKPGWAGAAIMLGYLFGDTLDGWVARKLNTQNEFGGEFDTIADHLSHVIAPGAVVYCVYKDVGLLPQPWGKVLAIGLAASMMISVSIRHARNIVAPIKFKGVWSGLPRTVYGFIAIAYCNATLTPHAPGGWWLGVGIIVVGAVLTLTYLPFPSHHLAIGGGRGFRLAATIAIALAFIATIGIVFVRREFFFDMLFFWMVGYCMSAWMTMTPDERKAHRAAVADTKARLAAAK
ncbi:MAG TPA: CDP-alcohol phosphatidyltransferase family protein [Kofleriaceae bacterium]|nr:CDP-alcohol phosphatidyltransferase family protein [Kofleriaceae bacterium]